MGAKVSQPEVDKALFCGEADWDTINPGQLSVDGVGTVVFRAWTPRDRPRGLVVCTHGLHEHGLRFSSSYPGPGGLAHSLTRNGFAVYAGDAVGHGETGLAAGSLGYVPSDEAWVQSSLAVARHAIAQHPSLPVFLVGHSLGTMVLVIVATALEQEDGVTIRAACFSGSALQAGPSAASPFGLTCLFWLNYTGPFIRGLAWLLSIIDPKGPNAPIFTWALSRDQEELNVVAADGLTFHGRVMNCTAYAALRLVERAKAALPSFTIPFLAMHGTADSVTLTSGSEMLVDLAGTAPDDKMYEPVEGAYHELLHETPAVTEAVVARWTDFLTSRLPIASE